MPSKILQKRFILGKSIKKRHSEQSKKAFFVRIKNIFSIFVKNKVDTRIRIVEY